MSHGFGHVTCEWMETEQTFPSAGWGKKRSAHKLFANNYCASTSSPELLLQLASASIRLLALMHEVSPEPLVRGLKI